MSQVIFRLLFDDTGRIRPPRFLPARTLLTGERMLARLSGPAAQGLPEDARPWIAARAAILRERLDALRGFKPPEPDAGRLAPSPEVLAIVGVEILNDPQRLDRLIEAMLRSLDNITLGHAELPEETPAVEIARALRAALFFDGRRFVQRPLDEQWLETENRLGSISPELLQESALLGVQTRLQHLTLLNEHLGRLLGLTASTPQPEGPSQHELNTQAAQALIALVAAIFSALPDPEEAGARADLLEPVLKEL